MTPVVNFFNWNFAIGRFTNTSAFPLRYMTLYCEPRRRARTSTAPFEGSSPMRGSHLRFCLSEAPAIRATGRVPYLSAYGSPTCQVENSRVKSGRGEVLRIAVRGPALLAFLVAAYAGDSGFTSGKYENAAGEKLSYRLFVPKDYSPG